MTLYNSQIIIPEVISYVSVLLPVGQLERLFVELASLTSRSLAISASLEKRLAPRDFAR